MTSDSEILDKVYNVNESFLARANQELLRAQRYLNFVSYAMIDTSHLAKTGEIEGLNPSTEFYKKLRKHIRVSLRQTDLISGFKDGRICVLLIETSGDGIKVVTERLQESIRYFLHELIKSPKNWRVEIHTGSFPSNDATPNTFLQKIKTDLLGSN
jgi:GGDEF domain-containing protein